MVWPGLGTWGFNYVRAAITTPRSRHWPTLASASELLLTGAASKSRDPGTVDPGTCPPPSLKRVRSFACAGQATPLAWLTKDDEKARLIDVVKAETCAENPSPHCPSRAGGERRRASGGDALSMKGEAHMYVHTYVHRYIHTLQYSPACLSLTRDMAPAG